MNMKRNGSYLQFQQSEFTVGDKKQFQKIVEPNDCIFNTFSYIFDKFSKGIYVKIYNGDVQMVPFSNANFENEWSHLVNVPDHSFMNELTQRQGHRYYPSTTNPDKKRWISNNGLIRLEHPLYKGGVAITILKDMFKALVQEKEVPNCEFFLNRRDFPLLKKDRTEPYDSFFGKNQELLSHLYDEYTPILSMVSNSEYEDITIPTWDEWARISDKEYKELNKSYIINRMVPWNDKKDIAIFRGTSTGLGVTIDTNPRLKLATLNHPNLDAGIVKWNLRPRKVFKEKDLQTINLDIPLKNHLTYQEQTKYKYIINVPGHVAAFRLAIEMSFESVILLVEGDYDMWFFKYMIPFVHFIPIKKDLSNLIDIIEWCLDNDDVCETIAQNAKKFYLDYLTKDKILHHLQQILIQTFGPPIQKEKIELTSIPLLPIYTRSWHYHEGLKRLFNENYKIPCHKKIGKYENVNELFKVVPNFEFTYNQSGNITYTEILDDIDWKTEWNIDYILSILFALNIAKKFIGFEHNNLFLNNIRCAKGGIFDYVFDNQIYRLKLNKTPVICNFLLSTRNENKNLDLTTFIRSFAINALSNRLDKKDLFFLFQLCNGLGGDAKSVKQLKIFFHQKTYFTASISDIIQIFLKYHKVERQNKLYYLPIDGNANQVYEFAISQSHGQRLDSYSEVIMNIKSSRFPLTTNYTLSKYFEFIFNKTVNSIQKLVNKFEKTNLNILEIKSIIQRIYNHKTNNDIVQLKDDFDKKYINYIVYNNF